MAILAMAIAGLSLFYSIVIVPAMFASFVRMLIFLGLILLVLMGFYKLFFGKRS